MKREDLVEGMNYYYLSSDNMEIPKVQKIKFLRKEVKAYSVNTGYESYDTEHCDFYLFSKGLEFKDDHWLSDFLKTLYSNEEPVKKKVLEKCNRDLKNIKKEIKDLNTFQQKIKQRIAEYKKEKIK